MRLLALYGLPPKLHTAEMGSEYHLHHFGDNVGVMVRSEVIDATPIDAIYHRKTTPRPNEIIIGFIPLEEVVA